MQQGCIGPSRRGDTPARAPAVEWEIECLGLGIGAFLHSLEANLRAGRKAGYRHSATKTFDVLAAIHRV